MVISKKGPFYMKNLILLCLIAMALTGCRFGIVDEGAVYRAPQLNEAQLQQAVDELKIKTIINLRGENPDDKWYKVEKKFAEKNGINLVNISMSAKTIPHRSNLIKLLDTFRDAPKPILIHCKAGVDRTGEASALYQMIYMQYSKDVALKMLSADWGHFEKNKPGKRYFIRDVWQGEEWARAHYYPCKANYKYYDKDNAECTSGNGLTQNLSAEEDS